MSQEDSRAAHHVEDLSVLSRRGALSAAEQRAFTEALDASATLATAHQLGLDFDQVATVRPGDDALIAAVAARAVSRNRPAGFGRFQRGALLLVAALALAGSATAFWQLTKAQPLALQSSAPRAAAPSTAPASAVARAATPESPAPVARPETTAENASPRPLLSAPSGPSTRADLPSERTFDSAESLFREANTARRAGDNAVARALYLRLEHDFPASDEAHLAHVSLGNLLLAMGRAGEAEQQFASYLGGHSALAQEALVGRAQSLALLGRSAEEQRVWASLLHDYPGSVYAGRASQRLAELAHGAARPE
jgi:TolA-binding protein